MIRENRATAVLRNYGAIAAVFVEFALSVMVTDLVFGNQAAAYLAGVAVIGLTWAFSVALKTSVARGFLPYCFGFLSCTAVFPASDMVMSTYASPILYAGFLGMLIFTVVLLWRAASYR